MPRAKSKPAVGPDAARRATRSAFQGSLVTALILLINLAVTPDLTPEQILIISTVALPVFSYLQNALEDAQVVPGMMKDAPLTSRKLDILATATGEHQQEIDRIERAVQDIRAYLALRPHDAEIRGVTGQVTTSGTAPERFRG